MIQDNQILNEVLDKAEDFELLTDDEITRIYGFKVNGHYIDVLFTKIHYEFRTIYNAEYEDADFSNFYNVDFTVDRDVEKHDNSYNENNFKIFATISKILETFVDNNDISGLMAVGNSDNKVKLYEKIFEKVLKQKFDKFDVSGNELAVYNAPKNQNLTEVLDKAKPYQLLDNRDETKYYSFEAGEQTIDVLFEKFPEKLFEEGDFSDFYKVDFTVDDRLHKPDAPYNDNNFEIFATISSILEEFANTFEPSGIGATANEMNKAKVYRRIFERKLKSKFDKFVYEGKNLAVYNLSEK